MELNFKLTKEDQMVDTRHVRDKAVILKIAAISKAVSTSVVSEENDGLWFSGGDLIGALGDAGIPKGMKSPAIFVPFSQIQWLIAENQ
jgi:hypothetical protein